MQLTRSELSLKSAFIPPQTILEAKIVSAFRSTFMIDDVGVWDNFFEMGGDSLTAEVLALNILKETGKDFEISWLLNHATPHAISALLGGDVATPVSSEHPPLFMVHGKDGIMLPSRDFLDGLASWQKMEIFEVPGLRKQEKILATVSELASHYIKRLQKTFPYGPILLAGTCTGCLIALEMAAQLEDMGRPIQQLLLIDPNAPDNVRRYMARLVGIRLPLFKQVKRWKLRIPFLLLRGRLTDGTHEADFGDDLLRRVRVFSHRIRISRERRKFEAGSVEVPHSDHAKAVLNAAYSHYKPRKYFGDADIISSEKRANRCQPDKSLWGSLVPNRRVHVVTRNHMDLFNAKARQTGNILQECIDRAVAKVADLTG